MQPLGNPMHHLRLLTRMGRAVGVDFSGAFEAKDISAEEWVEMIQSCRGCADPESCQRWLRQQEQLGELPADAAPPEYCCNADRLAQLRP